MHLESLDTNTVKPLDPVSSFNETEFASEDLNVVLIQFQLN
jgi:hypothetical protein